MGTCGVPTIGFGPGDEVDAHAVKERVAIDHLVKAMQFYAAFPLEYVAVVEEAKTRRAVPAG
jgi:acetylornithine deacetylase/succinyl-diaminopimelate desuccinylase-like protein